MSTNIGQRIADPRQLSDELGADQDQHAYMYSNLANYTFGAPRPSLSPHDAVADTSESISPLSLPRLSPDRTPRPSVAAHFASPPFNTVSSHPSHSQVEGRLASSHHASSSQSRRQSYTRDPSYAVVINPSGSRSPAVSGSDSERSEDPSSSTDPITAAFASPQRARLMSDNASLHTFGRGRASHTHGIIAASSQDGAPPSSSSVSVTTSRSSSRASMRTMEQFSSDDELEIDDYYDDDGNSSPVTFARYDLADIDEDADLVDPRPPSIRSFVPDGRRGSIPMAIPGAVQASDAYSIRSREGSIRTVRRPSRSWDDASTYRSSHSGGDPTLMHPKSEPNSRADWLSLGAQRHAPPPPPQQQQQDQEQQPIQPSVLEGFDLGYILSKREGSVRSGHSGLSFVRGAVGARISSPYLFQAAGSATTLPFEDSFMRHIQKHDRAFGDRRYYWSFQRERADASSSSLRRRQQAHHHRNDKTGKESGPRVQEMWRCGHVGRFKVDKIVFKPQSADSGKGTQQRIHIRRIPDPFLGNTSGGPHSVIHKHSRAIAFSIFRSHSLFSGRQVGGTGAGPSSTQTHMNMRSGIMLAPKKVQEQYTSTKTMRQFNTHGFLDGESRGGHRGTQGLSFRERDKERRRGQEKEHRGKGKTLSKSKGKGNSAKKLHRANPTESTGSSSAGSVTNNATKILISGAAEQPVLKIQFSPSTSSSMGISQRDSISRPSSPPSLIINSVHLPESETSSIPPIRHYHRDSLDSDDRLPTRTTHAEAFSALDPNDIENLRAKANNRANADSGSTLAERLFRVFRGGARTDDHSSGSQARAFQPPWMITAGRDQQEENDRVLSDLNASFRDVGLLHTNPHKGLKMSSKRKSNQGILDRVPDDSLYMLLPLWPGETDTASVHAETSSAASFVTVPDNRHYLLVYYVPFSEADPNNRKPEKKKAKQSLSSDSGIEIDSKSVYLPAFRAVAQVVTYDELRLSGIRVPSDGLAISVPEWEAMNYSGNVAPPGSRLCVVCQCDGKSSGFDFLEDGLLQLGLCTPEDSSSQVQDIYGENPETEAPEQPVKMQLTAIGKAAVEMIWLGCLALTSFSAT